MSSTNIDTNANKKAWDEITKLSPYRAPSGQFYECNDIEYLIDNGYSLQDAMYELSRSRKYLTQYTAPNGKLFDANDIEYLLDNGYSLSDALDELSYDEQYSDGSSSRKNTDSNKTIYTFSIFGRHAFCDHDHNYEHHYTTNSNNGNYDDGYDNCDEECDFNCDCDADCSDSDDNSYNS